MSLIASNISKLILLGKISKMQEIVTMSTANPNVPGNAALVTALSTALTALVDANNACEEHRQAGKGLTAARNTALQACETALTALAGFTEGATEGDADKILTTGFDVKAEPQLPQPVPQVENVKVRLTTTPGYSDVTWKRESNADAYVLERSPDPITPTSWVNVATVREAKYLGNGTVPGLKYWYRVAGVNKLGQGSWSEPAMRPVL